MLARNFVPGGTIDISYKDQELETTFAKHLGVPLVLANGDRCRMTLTGLIIFLVIGAVAGWLAGQIMKGGGFGLVGDIVVGVIGSLIGGWLFGVLGIAVGGLIGSIIAAVVGAIILIALLRLIKRA